jgi:hydroxymethylglutaryl-CoA lyase
MQDQAEIIEIGPRKGFQYHQKYINIETKVAFINMLFDAGFRQVEGAAFVHPRVMPQMRDSFEVLQKINSNPKGICQALIPNETGCRNAIACGAKELVVWIYTNDELNYISQHRTRSETLKEINSIVQIAKENKAKVNAWVAGTFGYPGMNPPIAWQGVKELAAKLIQLGCEEVCLGDEFCMANPKLIKEVIKVYFEEVDRTKLLFHFHDNKGLGLANIIAAYEEGIGKFKTCIGGTGRQMDLNNGEGNEFNQTIFPTVATEDVVYAFEEMGIRTNINFPELIKCGLFAENILGKKLHSLVIKNHLY